MSNDGDTADRLERYFGENERVPELAIATAKDLFGLRTADDELIELSSASATRDDAPADNVLRFEFGDVTVLVERDADRARVLVVPVDAHVFVETAEHSNQLELDEHGEAMLARGGPVRLRIRLADGSTGVTDGFDPSTDR